MVILPEDVRVSSTTLRLRALITTTVNLSADGRNARETINSPNSACKLIIIKLLLKNNEISIIYQSIN